jgi:hypothetical protein
MTSSNEHDADHASRMFMAVLALVHVPGFREGRLFCKAGIRPRFRKGMLFREMC